MPLEHLLAALEREATDRSQALLAAARAEADRISKDSQTTVARRRADALCAREADLRGSAEAGLGDARRASRAAVLKARQRFIDRVFAGAEAMFPLVLQSPTYRSALPGHIAEALAALGEEPVVIRCPEAVAQAVREAARAPRVVVQSDRAAPAGILVATTDGAIEVDNTLSGRLERQRSALALEVLARLEATT